MPGLRSTALRAALVGAVAVTSVAASTPSRADSSCPPNVLLSRTPSGGPSTGVADRPSMSPGGNHVVFDSKAGDLVPGVEGNTRNVFLANLSSGHVDIVSKSVSGQPNGISTLGTVSEDGRFVAFVSEATNLPPGDGYPFGNDVFLRDMVADTTQLLSVGIGGAAANQTSTRPAVDGAGRYVAFNSNASNLVAGDSNGTSDIFLRDTVAGTTILVNVAAGGGFSSGRAYRPEISADGRYVAFVSNATDLVPGFGTAGKDQVYVRDLALGTTKAVSVSRTGATPPNSANRPSISGDGRYIVFQSAAHNITLDDNNGYQDVFRRDMVSGQTVLASVAHDGSGGEKESVRGRVTDDGKVLFDSFATNLVPDDGNAKRDVFLRDLAAGTTTKLSNSIDCGGGDGISWRPEIDGRGTVVTFLSGAANLVAGDTNGTNDVFGVRLTPPPRDLTAPSGTIDTPSPDQVFDRSTIALAGTAADDVGVSGVAIGVRNEESGFFLQPDGSFDAFPATIDAALDSPGRIIVNWNLTVSLPNGRYAVTARAADPSGNVDPEPPRSLFQVDADVTAPTADSFSPADGSSVEGPNVVIRGRSLDDRGVASVALTVKDRTTGKYLRPDGTFGSHAKLDAAITDPGAETTPWSLSVDLPVGSYQYGVTTTDTAGLQDPDKHFTNFSVREAGASPDTVPPTVNGLSPTDRSTVAGPNVSITGTATDDRGVASVLLTVKDRSTGKYLRPDGTWGTQSKLTATLSSTGSPSSDWTLPVQLPDGSYQYGVTAVDTSGLQDPDRHFTTFVVASSTTG